MTRKLFSKAAIILTVLAASASAGGHSPIEQRQTAMKAVGEQMRTLGGMARGTVAYDDFGAISALEIMRNSVFAASELFPEGSDSGFETRSLPAIWADGSDFDDRMVQILADLDAAIAAEPADQAAFMPLFGAVAKGCGGCHELYRAPEE